MVIRTKELKGLNKNTIIEEYLSGKDSFKTLGEKYGISERTIQSWVRVHRKKQIGSGDAPVTQKEGDLQKELEHLKLKNALLEEIINLSEKQTGLSLRKKFGPKQ